MLRLLCFVLFLSGSSALIFEYLWFRLCGLVLGNSVASAAIVLASFMGGLALGNALMSRWGEAIRRPIRFYAFLEVAIAVMGMTLVLILPHLTKFLVPFLRPFLDEPFALNALRALTALMLMLVPATAMGATLPVIVKAFNRQEKNFGRSLGLMYAANTLGAVSGVLLTELVLVKYLGIRAAGFLAMSLNLTAAVLAIMISSRAHEATQPAGENNPAVATVTIPLKLLAISFFTGLIFLALEIVWFRFLALFFNAYSLNFTIMLALVLAGISVGGFWASYIFKDQRARSALLADLILINAALIVLLYAFFERTLLFSLAIFPLQEAARLLLCSAVLILPVATVSGLIFTVTGKLLHERIGKETLTTGLLTLVNTLGSMIGSFLGGFILIPYLGIERAFFLSAFVYGLLAVCAGDIPALLRSGPGRRRTGALLVIFLGAVLLFPFGKIKVYLDISIQRFVSSYGERRVAVKEGINETVQYLQKDLLGEPHYQRLMTNGHSMSGTMLDSVRYMKMFVYLPVAVNPAPRKAALICFGCGVTAKALTDTQSLESIDIVDTSPEIIELSRVVFPREADNPIFDRRALIHIEDGRFFLLASDKKFDLITGEPPPPKFRGVASLFSQEYFQLMFQRLNDGGFVTYWLPVYMMHPHESKSVLKAFCNVFTECSLWAGSGLNWIMAGVKNPATPVSAEAFGKQWADENVGAELRRLGFPSSEEFGALFIADKADIDRWTQGAKALTDNFPKRLESPYDESRKTSDMAEYTAFLDEARAWKNFRTSPSIARIWPAELIEASRDHFPHAHHALKDNPVGSLDFIKTLHGYLNEPLVGDRDIDALLGSNARAQEIVMKMLEENGFTLAFFAAFARSEAAKAQENGDHALVDEWLEACKHAAAYAVKHNEWAAAQHFYGLIASFNAPQNARDFIFLSAYFLAREGQWEKMDELLIKARQPQDAENYDDLRAWLRSAFRHAQFSDPQNLS